MTSTTGTDTGPLLHTILTDLRQVVGAADRDQDARPTPCRDFTVADLRHHILGWLTFFAAAVADPHGRTRRPDPATHAAPDDPADAADQVAAATRTLDDAIADGVENGDIVLTQGAMPGGAALQLILWEYLVHGWDLAVATGQSWTPPEAAAEHSLTFAQGMLTPEWRGSQFGEPVEVPAAAPALDRVLGFTGRDPSWRAR